jgi:hypothetical protein
MEFSVKAPFPSSFIDEATKEKQTIAQYIQVHISEFLDMLNHAPLSLSLTDNGELFIQINIDLHGIMRVIGGVSYYNKASELIELILVDEGASFLLFQIKNNIAFFYGGLNGVEFKRFNETDPGHHFNYYRRKYTKLTMQEVDRLVDQKKIYYYDTPKTVDDPRKKIS